MRRARSFLRKYSRGLVFRICALTLGLALLSAGSVSAQQVGVDLPDTTGIAGETSTIPVQVDDLTGKGVLSFEFSVSYNPDTLSVVEVETAGTIASDMNVVSNTENSGEVIVSGGGVQALSGSGPLVNLKVRYKGAGTSSLEWNDFQFNEGSPAADVSGGTVTVEEPPPGDITVSLPDTTGEVGDSATVPITVSDTDGPNGEGVLSLDFTFSYDNSLVTVDTVTTAGTLTESWTIESDASTPGEVSVSAGNTETLSGSDRTLVKLKLSYKAEGTSSFNWQDFQFNEGDPTAELINGQAMVTAEGTSPPSSPDGLEAKAGDGVVDLTWNESSESDLAGYNLYRSTSSFSEIGEMNPINGGTVLQAATYSDQDVENGTEYFYRVTAVDSDGNESSLSGEVSATPSPGPFADWPETQDPSITLKVVNTTNADAEKVRLEDVQDETGSNLSEKPIEGGFASFKKEDIQFMNKKVVKIEILDSDENVVGYLPFRYKLDDLTDGVGIDAIVYVHGEDSDGEGAEGVLQPSSDRWSDRWDYYEDIQNPHPLSMIVPPGGDVGSVQFDKKDPVVLIHGVSGRYPSWGNDIEKARNLVKRLSNAGSGAGYDAWQFYYPENQDITKSGPLLAKAINQLQNNLGYGPDQSFDLVAHSMGGLVSRHFVQKMGIGKDRKKYSQVLGETPDPDQAIDKFLMLGTPNYGSFAAWECSGAVGGCSAFGKDVGAPAYRQMTPGSKFLDDLNRSDNPSQNYSSASTLVIAGTRNPLPVSTEIPDQSDAAVAVSSAGLLDLGIPLAVGDFTHSAGFDKVSPTDPRLNEDEYTGEIITYFLSNDHGAGMVDQFNGKLGDGITGYWKGSEGGENDPDPADTRNLSMDRDEGILTLNLKGEGSSVGDLGLTSQSQCGTNLDGCLRTGGFGVGITKVVGETRFFSYSFVLTSLGFGTATGLEVGTSSIEMQRWKDTWGYGGKWESFGATTVTARYLQAIQNDVEIEEANRALAGAGSSTSRVGGSESETSKASLREGVAKAQVAEAQFQISAVTDTLLFWLTKDGTGGFSGHNMRLVTPDGSVVDSTTANSKSDLEYAQNLSVGSATYLVTDPMPGRWTVRYDASVDATVTAPVMGAVNLKARVPDSSYSEGEAIPVSVSFSDQNAYQGEELEANLWVENSDRNGAVKVGSLSLGQNTSTKYEGTFTPSYVGTYRVAVNFSAEVGGESVLRRTSEAVQVTGDTTDTVPDPPPAPTDLNAEIQASDGVALNWSLPASGSADEYRIFRDTIPNPTRQVASVSSGQTSYTDTGVLGGKTYYYRVAAAGTGGVESEPTDGASVFTYPSSLSVDIQRSFGDASSEQGYRLVALPGATGQPLEEALGGEAGSEWQAWWDTGSSEDYFQKFDGSDTFRFQAGRGFWALSRSDWSVQKSVQTVPLESGQQQTSIPLHGGWNIISNPFGQDVSWAQVDAAHSDSLRALWRFDGSFAEADTFRSAQVGEAFYFLNDTGLDSLKVPYPTGSAAKSRAKSTSQEESSLVTVRARTKNGDGPASAVKVGFDKNAAEGLGRLDEPAPPGRFSALSLRLRAPGEAPPRRQVLMTERRPPKDETEEGDTFELQLQSETGGPVQITADGISAIGSAEAKLLRPSTGRSYDLAEGESVTIEEADSTALKLAVGSAAYVQDREQEILPDEVSLTSYPNPMRRQATLEYTLTEATDVRLEVYDVLGRRVAVLADGPKEAGRHQLQFDGGRLASGVYFGQLETEDQTRTQKITIVR